jgi:predicted MFS family arabinose efflux permease
LNHFLFYYFSIFSPMLRQFFVHWKNAYSGIPPAIWFLSAVNLINRCGAMVVSFLALYMTQHLGISIDKAGFAMMFFGIGALVGNYLGGRLTDRIGYYWVQFGSLVLNGIIMMCLLAVRDLPSLCAVIFLLSVCSEAFRPANSVSILRNSDDSTRTRSISLYRMSANLGWSIAPALGGLLVAFGWHWLFWVDGASCILAALMLLLRMQVPKDDLPAKGAATEALKSTQSPLRDKVFVWFVVVTAIGAVVFMQLLWTIPVFFKEAYHWSEQQIGLMVALNGLLVFLIEMPLIFQIEGRRPTMSYVRFGFLLYLLAYLALLSPITAVSAALLYMLFISLGEIFVMPFSSNFVMGRAPDGQQGAYSAYYMMAYSLANIAAPPLGTQVIAHHGFFALWSSVAVLAVLALSSIWYLQRRVGAATT